jgi:hypothetical protein
VGILGMHILGQHRFLAGGVLDHADFAHAADGMDN